MTKSHYGWSIGDPPPALGVHSLAKHRVVYEYLQKYVSVLGSRRVLDGLKLTLVDGFAGGGEYLHPETKQVIAGSPLLMLNAMCAAEAIANEDRRKKFVLDVEYIFIEKRRETAQYLKETLAKSPEAASRPHRIQIVVGEFSDLLDKTLASVERQSRSGRVIFLLDQYGYTDVPMSDLRKIFKRLPNAEVILTLAVDWLIDICGDDSKFETIISKLEFSPQLVRDIKQEHPTDWRAVVQHKLHSHFFEKSGADYYTPFFIHSVDAHRAYWLLHFSKHNKARDVMVGLHWSLENHFQHFGQAGLGMLGYDARKDVELWKGNQTSFKFDSLAAGETEAALLDDIPRRLSLFKNGISFGAFFDDVVNETPASMEMIGKQIRQLSSDKDVEIRTADGACRRNGVKVQKSDIIVLPAQRRLFQIPRQSNDD